MYHIILPSTPLAKYSHSSSSSNIHISWRVLEANKRSLSLSLTRLGLRDAVLAHKDGLDGTLIFFFFSREQVGARSEGHGARACGVSSDQNKALHKTVSVVTR